MKRQIGKIICAALLLTATVLMFGTASEAYAADSSVGDETYEVEYVSTNVVIPLIRTADGQTYSVEVFDKSDSDFSDPLPRNGFTFTPEKLGEYTIRYLINDNGSERTSYATLVLTDTTAPQFDLTLESEYRVGDTVDFVPKITDNTSHWATVKYTLLCNGTSVGKAVESGRITLDTAGDYKLRVSVTDAGGNQTAQTYRFTVTGEPVKNNGWVIWVCCFGGGAVLIAAGVVLFLVLKKRKAASGKETSK